MSFNAIALLFQAHHCLCFSSRRSAFLRPRRSSPLSSLPVLVKSCLCFRASLCLSPPSPSRSTRLNAIALLIKSLPHQRQSFLVSAMPLPHITMLLRCSSALINAYAVRYDAKQINAFAGPSRAKPFFCYAKASLGYALPLLVCSPPLLNYAVPSRISTPLLPSGSTPCHTTATPGLAMPSRLNALLSRRDTLRSHASPVPSYSLPRPCHAEQFPCVTLIRPAIAVQSHAIATHSHATTKQCLTLPPQFQADRIYAIAFLCLAILCRRISVLNHSIQCRRKSDRSLSMLLPFVSTPCNSVQSIATALSRQCLPSRPSLLHHQASS